MTIKTVKDAINDALVQSFEEDKNVILMGEDIAGGKGREQYQGTQDAWGGPFGVTRDFILNLVPKEFEILLLQKQVFSVPLLELQ